MLRDFWRNIAYMIEILMALHLHGDEKYFRGDGEGKKISDNRRILLIERIEKVNQVTRDFFMFFHWNFKKVRNNC